MLPLKSKEIFMQMLVISAAWPAPISTGLSHRGRQCRSNSEPATRGEEESLCEERSRARYHRYSSPWHAAEQRSSPHYADLTQASRRTSAPATKTTSAALHIIRAIHAALLLSPLRSAAPSASSGTLVMSISVTQAPRFDLTDIHQAAIWER